MAVVDSTTHINANEGGTTKPALSSGPVPDSMTYQSGNFLDVFADQISKPNSYPMAVLMPIYEAIKARIEAESGGEKISKPALILNDCTPDTFTIWAAHQNLCRINTGACVLEDHIEELLVIAEAATAECYKALHSALASSLMVKQLSGELLEHLDVVE